MPTKADDQTLQDRVFELEQQLAEAQEVILALSSTEEAGKRAKDVQKYERLREREARFQFLAGDQLNAFAIFSVIPDEQGKVSDFRVKYVNADACALTGRKLEDTLGKTILELYPGFEQTGIFRWCVQVIETRKSISREGYALDTSFCSRPGTRYYNFRISRLGDQLSIFWRDVTERVRSAQVLRESKTRFSKAFMAAPHALAISRVSDGRIVEVNESFERLFDYSKEEVIGRTSLELGLFVDPSDRQAAIEQVREHGFLRDFELEIRTRIGEARPVSLSIEQLNIDQEDHILTIIHDLTERKRVEAALRASEQEQQELARSLEVERARLAAILENLPVGVWIADQNGRLIGKNVQADRIWAGDAPLSGSIEEYPQYVAWFPDGGKSLLPEEHPVAKALQTGQPIEPVELNIRRFDGTEGTVLVSAAPIIDREGRLAGVVGVNMDITKRKRAEAALRESEARFRTVFERAEIGIVIGDMNGRVIESNPAFGRMLGYSQPELHKKAFTEFTHPDDAVTEWSLVQDVLSGKRDHYEIEKRYIRKDGQMILVRLIGNLVLSGQGEPLFEIALIEDITERKQAEQALRESEERLHALVSASAQAIYRMSPDWQEMRLLQGGNFLKDTPEPNRNWLQKYIPPDDQPGVLEAIENAKRTGEVFELEHQVLRADGSIGWTASRAVPVRNTENEIVEWFGAASDITERKRAEKALAEVAKQLERSNRELEQFAFVASHDLQEPLRKIEAFGDSLLESVGQGSTQLDERGRKYVERMRSAAGRMRDMVDGLLQLSRVTTQGQPFITVDLSRIAADVLSDLEYQVRHTSGKVEISALPVVEGDPLQLHRLLQNLIGNALKYHRPDTTPRVKVNSQQLSDRVQIRVEDNGIGFNPEEVEQVFQPFQRLVGRNKYEGSGMGLAICRRIVERHGGEITAKSELGKGATFIVILPVRMEDEK